MTLSFFGNKAKKNNNKFSISSFVKANECDMFCIVRLAVFSISSPNITVDNWNFTNWPAPLRSNMYCMLIAHCTRLNDAIIMRDLTISKRSVAAAAAVCTPGNINHACSLSRSAVSRVVDKIHFSISSALYFRFHFYFFLRIARFFITELKNNFFLA